MAENIAQPGPGTLLPGWRYRVLEAADAQAVCEAFQSSADMGRQGDVQDAAGAEKYVHAHLSNQHCIALVAVDEDNHARAFAAAQVDQANRSAWVYYWAHAQARGQGVTSALVRTLADWMIDRCGIQRLELGYRLNNPASAAVAKKAGFVVEGIERGKFLIDGARIDAAVAARLDSDPHPA